MTPTPKHKKSPQLVKLCHEVVKLGYEIAEGAPKEKALDEACQEIREELVKTGVLTTEKK